MRFTKQLHYTLQKQEQSNYPLFISEVQHHFILWVPDIKIEFSGNRHPDSYHDKDRPAAVTKKEPLSATFVPATSRRKVKETGKHINITKDRYAVHVKGNAIKGLVKPGWFITRYPQTEMAKSLEKWGVHSGPKIPDRIFDEIIRKMELFIQYQNGSN